MKAIRRIYIYLVAFVSLEVVAWSVIGLGRSAFGGGSIGGGTDQLASALAFILVGLPIFLIHWWLAQRDAAKEPEEHYSGMRALFLYGTWLSLFVPVVQNTLVIIERTFALLLGSAIGADLTWTDNLVGIVVNGVLALYFLTVIRANWKDTPLGNMFPLIRRIARYLVMLYGYGILFAGVQQLLSYLFELVDAIGGGEAEILVNGLSFILIGTPLWIVTWRLIQRSLEEPAERDSLLRWGVLYGLTFLAVVSTLISGGYVLDEILRAALGATSFTEDFTNRIGESISVMVPALISWIFYNRVLKQEIEATTDVQHQAGMHRLYAYVLSLLGLGSAFIGTYMLINFILDLLVSQNAFLGGSSQEGLADALATLLIGLPVWVWAWRQMIAEAAQKGEAGDHARRSVIRKGYLYFILFVGVMGIMGTTGSFLYNLIKVALGDEIPDFMRLILDVISLLILFIVLAYYHWRSLSKDNQLAAESLSALHAGFSVCVFDHGEGEFAERVLSALKVVCPDVPVAIHPVGESFDETLQNAGAAVLPASLATDPPEAVRLWLNEFSGIRLFVPTEAERWRWVGFTGDSLDDLSKEVAKTVCWLAEGQEIARSRSLSGWTVLGYVFSVLVGISILCGLVSALIELLY
jgi:preprotein translocase subunit YajC